LLPANELELQAIVQSRAPKHRYGAVEAWPRTRSSIHAAADLRGAMKFAPDAERRPGLLTGMLTAIGNGLGGDRSLTHRLSVAGFRVPNAAALFLSARTLVSLGPALLVLVPAVSSGEALGRALMTAALYWSGGHVLANLWLKRRTRARVGQITPALPDALDLMGVCLDAGLGLNATIARVGEERSTTRTSRAKSSRAWASNCATG
jgi:Flp pilus assembly protein TadB